jgi:hypothetical protein
METLTSTCQSTRLQNPEEELFSLLFATVNSPQCCYCFRIYYHQYIPVWWPGLKNSPTVTHSCRKRRLKWVPSVWGYSWATLSPGVIHTETWSSRLGVGRWTNNPAL